MDRDRHIEITLDYYRKAALERGGFYDATDDSRLEHSLWQRLVRRHIRHMLTRLSIHHQSLVDVGCGNGDFIRELAIEFPTIAFRGHDSLPEMIQVANQHKGEVANVSYRVDDLLSVPETNEQFDIVLCLNMFHHLHADDLDRGMEAIASRASGSIIFELKNEGNFWNRSFRPDSAFPFTLISPKRVISFFASKGFACVSQWNIFLLEFLSPIVILEFKSTPIARRVRLG